MNKVDHITNSR